MGASLCSGTSKSHHKSMDDLSFSAKAATFEHPFNYNEVQSTNNTRTLTTTTLPINTAIFNKPTVKSPSPDRDILSNKTSSNADIQLNQNYSNQTNNFLKHDNRKSNSIGAETMASKSINVNSNMSNLEKFNSQTSDQQRNFNVNSAGQKVTYNALGQPIHPGLRSVSRNLPTYSQLVGEGNSLADKYKEDAEKKLKAATFKDQIALNSLNEKAKINSNYHLNLKNQYLPFQSSIDVFHASQNASSKPENSKTGMSAFEQQRIASLSPTTGFPEKNAKLKSNPSLPIKNLPSYNSYVNNPNKPVAKKQSPSFEPLTKASNQTAVPTYPFSNLISQNPDRTSTTTAQIQLANANKFKFQQNKSKSFDAGQMPHMMTINAIDQSNTQGGYQNQNQEEEMPQSALILEKLKRFETNTDTKPFSQSSNVNSRFTEQPKSGSYIDKPNELGRGLIDENNRIDNSMNRLLSPKRTSPMETNKENSPFTTNRPATLNPQQLHMFQPGTLTSSTSSNQFNNNNNNKNTTANKSEQIKQQQALFLQNMGYVPNKNGLGFSKEISRASPSKGLLSQSSHTPTFSQFKYNQYASPVSNFNTHNQFSKATSTPPVINSSLAAATAAASAALAKTQTTTPQSQPTNNSLKNSKTIKSDYSIANKLSTPTSGFNNDNYDFLSLPQHESSAGNSMAKQSSPQRLERNDREKSLGNTSFQEPSIVSKRAALFEQKLEQRNLSPQYQSYMESSRSTSFNRSNLSPANKITKIEDAAIDMHSSSGGSIGSFKENKRPISIHDSHSIKFNKKVELAQDIESSSSEPHKMSISEKMKMFQPANTSQASIIQNRFMNSDSFEVKPNKSTNKRYQNRFQTQPVSLADFEYANENYISQVNLGKPSSQNDATPKQQPHHQPQYNFSDSKPKPLDDRSINFNKLQYSATSWSTDSTTTSSPSSLTTSTSSATSNHDQVPSATLIQNSIQNLKLELDQKPVQHVLTNRQNQLNNIKNCMNNQSFNKSRTNLSNSDKTKSIEVIDTMQAAREIIAQRHPTIEPVFERDSKKIQGFNNNNNNNNSNTKSMNSLKSKIHDVKSENLNSRINFESKKYSVLDSSPAKPTDLSDQETLENRINENKRYKVKNNPLETFNSPSNFMSLPVESSEKSPSRDNLSDDENTAAPMTIQERMAALKKNNSMDWKKKQRSPPSNSTSADEPSGERKVSLVKQHQMQLKQQLQMATPKTQTPYQLRAEMKNREILAELDNNDDLKEQDTKLSSNENLDKQDTPNLPKPKTPSRKSLVFNAELEKALSSNKTPGSKQRLLSMGGSDSDSMLLRNANLLGKPLPKIESTRSTEISNLKPELFSTDSEMDSFFRESDPVGSNGQNYRYNDLFSSSCGSRTDENLNEDDDFDKIVTGGQRLTHGTRAKPGRKTKSKGNHLKNLQNRTEVKNNYEEEVTSPRTGNQPLVTADLLQSRLNKSSVLN